VTGAVADVRSWLSRASVYACPMRSGTGIKNKLLEALANGLPAVATTLAAQGLAVRSGRELVVEDQAERFAAAVVKLLRDRSAAERMGTEGAEYVSRHHAWGAVAAA